jgi:16S rRNA (uracil1498-N3)-methyltransferase
MHRFIVTDLTRAAVGETIALNDDEAHHVRDVLRLVRGSCLEVFDGMGRSCAAVVAEINRRVVTVQVSSAPIAECPRMPALWLAVAPPKADRLRWLVEKATELGVDRLTPLITRRTVVNPGEGKRLKLEASVVQACKQCGRNTLMQISEPRIWERFWQEVERDPDGHATRIVLADRDGGVAPLDAAGVSRRIVLIGPEGGLSPEERQQALDRGAVPVSFGTSILRIETAAIAAAAIFQAPPRNREPTDAPRLP